MVRGQAMILGLRISMACADGGPAVGFTMPADRMQIIQFGKKPTRSC
jgi:hypothetical protein